MKIKDLALGRGTTNNKNCIKRAIEPTEDFLLLAQPHTKPKTKRRLLNSTHSRILVNLSRKP